MATDGPDGTLPPTPAGAWLRRVVDRFERAVVVALLALLTLLVVLAVADVAAALVRALAAAPALGGERLVDLFGLVLLVLMGLELLAAVRAYLDSHTVHVEFVLELALVAVARKVITIDLAAYSGLTWFSVAALVLALAVARVLVRRAPD